MDDASLKRRLSERGLLASNDWLDQCINFFKSDNEQYTSKDLEEFAFNQWLLISLRDLKTSSFPPDLAAQRKLLLTGRYSCQIESILDIGHPAYSQYQEVTKKDTTNLAFNDQPAFDKKWEPKSSQTFMLYLCDGTQEVKALEYRRIPFLNKNIVPGVKAVVKGPVMCRKGIILLEAKNLEILGGEVESFLLCNAYENILAASLNLPMNPNPYRNTGGGNDTSSETTQPVADRNEDNQRRPVNVREENNHQRPIARPAGNNVPAPTIANHAYQQLEDEFFDDDALLNIDVDVEADIQILENVQNVETLEENTSKRLRAEQRLRPLNQCHSTIASSDFAMESDDEDILLLADSLENGNLVNDAVSSETFSKPSTSLNTQQTSISSFFTNEIPEPSTSFSSKRIPLNSTAQSNHSSYSKPTPVSSFTRNSRKPNVSSQPKSAPITSFFSKNTRQPNTYSCSEQTSTGSTSSGSKQTSMGSVSSSKNHSDSNQDDMWMIDSDFEEANLLNLDESILEVSEATNTSSSPFTYLANIIKETTCQRKKVVVKAIITKVVEKITIKDGDWHLVVEITDGSANLAVTLSPEVVTSIFQLTAAELMSRKKEAMFDAEKKMKLKKHFEEAQDRVRKLNTYFELEILPDQGPRVIEIHEVCRAHVDLLKNRSK